MFPQIARRWKKIEEFHEAEIDHFVDGFEFVKGRRKKRTETKQERQDRILLNYFRFHAKYGYRFLKDKYKYSYKFT